MDRLGFDVLPIDEGIKRCWVRQRALLEIGVQRPILRTLKPADLISATTPVFDVLPLMVVPRRRFYFTLAGATITGLVAYSDLDKGPLRTSVFALVNAVRCLNARKPSDRSAGVDLPPHPCLLHLPED